MTRKPTRKMPRKTPRPAAALAAIEVRASGIHGHGVFAVQPLRAGQSIGRYTGKRYAANTTRAGWDDQLTYLFGLSDGTVIDGAQGGNATRHLNHSCEPNVEAEESVDGRGTLVVTIRALRDIAVGDELFLDYALVVDAADAAAYPCRCGSARCRGTLAGVPEEAEVSAMA